MVQLTIGQHIFYNHLLPRYHQIPELKQSFQLIWPSVFLIICFLLLVVIKVTSFQKVVKVIQSCFSIQSLRQMELEKFKPFKFYSVALSVFFLLNLTFFIYKINYMYKLVLIEHSSIAQFMFFLLAITLLFTVKGGFSKILAVFVNDDKLIPEFIFSSFIVSQTLGLLIFPCMVMAELSTFNPLIFLSAASVILIAMQVFKWYRGMVFALVINRVGLLQIFTYFCSLEILPALILVKFVIENF
jgi:hypothetical protein